MEAIIISIGDELILGQILDTNSAWLSSRLAEFGILTKKHLTVPDDRKTIVAAVLAAVAEATLVLITGGLGPTADDLTRQALADVAGSELIINHTALAGIELFFKNMHRPMPESNRVQAMFPFGAECLDNACGTAPGLKLFKGQAMIVAMPGVPREMKAMFERHLAPALATQSSRVVLTCVLHTIGTGESMVAEQLGDLMERSRNPKVGTTASAGVVSVRVRSEGDDYALTRRALEETVAQVRAALGNIIFGEGDENLTSVLAGLLTSAKKTVATAESCTGGLLGKLFTCQPGASAYYLGGWIAYANEFKMKNLAVPQKVLDTAGAVSRETAVAMAEFALVNTAADYALASTGIAGPDGATASKPLGTVWIAMATRTKKSLETVAEHFIFPGSREQVRERAANAALNMLRLKLLGISNST